MTRSGLPAVLRCLALDQVAATACAELRDRGIDSVVLKGPGLSRRLGTERLYTDIDLLVAPHTFDAVQEVFVELGYQPVPAGYRADDWTNWHERPWRVPGPVRLVIDLHRGFAGVDDPDAFWTALSTAAQPITLAAGAVRVPDEAGAALLTALHAAAPGPSNRPRGDLTRALDVFAPSTWAAAARIAERSRATAAFALGLRLDPAGTARAAELALPHQFTALQWITAQRESATAHTLAQVAELPTTRARLRHLGRRLAPPPTSMRVTSAVARRGPAGLAVAYLLRLAHHARCTPAALRRLRTANRLAHTPGRDG